MNPNREQAIKDIYKIAGMLEALTCMQDQPLTSGMVAELIDAVDKLELIGAELMNAGQEITIDCQLPSQMIDIFDVDRCKLLHDKRPVKKVVKAHEGSEETALEPPTADQ